MNTRTLVCRRNTKYIITPPTTTPAHQEGLSWLSFNPTTKLPVVISHIRNWIIRQAATRRCYLVITHIMLSGCLHAQTQDLFFEHLNYEEGFASSMISSIIQDNNGFIWLGTEGGLLRYDGYHFVRHSRDQAVEGTISNNHVNCIYEDRERNLWIGTSNGVNHFDFDTKVFSPIDILPIKGGRNYVTSITEDSLGNIWVGTFGGVKKLNKESKKLENGSLNSTSGLFTSARVLSLVYEPSIGMIVGTSTGVFIFDPKTGKNLPLPAEWKANEPFRKAKIWEIVSSEQGDLWFASKDNGAYHYSKETQKLTNYLHSSNDPHSIASNWIYDILPVDENTIWFASIDGISILNTSTQKFTTHVHHPVLENSLSDNEVKSLFKDKNNNIWVGTSAGGLNLFNQANMNFFKIGESNGLSQGLSSPIVNTLFIEKEQLLWIGTRDGINKLNLETNTITNFKNTAFEQTSTDNRSNIIKAINRLDEDHLILGTLDGLFTFSESSSTFDKVPLTGDFNLENEELITSLVVLNNDLWIGTDGMGMILIRPDGTKISYKTSGSDHFLSDNYITDIEVAGEQLWVSTLDGLNLFDWKTGQIDKIYKSDQEGSISNNNLTCLFNDSQNRLWVGTDFGGLNYFDQQREQFYVINKASGLTDNSIRSITEDLDGNIWVSSGASLYKLSIQTENEGKLEVDITTYSSSDGLSFGQFSQKSSIQLPENRLAFGTSRGLIIFQAEDLIKAPSIEKVVLCALMINNQEVLISTPSSPLTKDIADTYELLLTHDQNYLELEFSTMNFTNPLNIRYAYKLERSNQQAEWLILGSQNSVNLSNLDPGEYLFSVKAFSQTNPRDDSTRTLKIRIKPPWWQSSWAYLIYSALILLLIVGITRVINIRLKLKRALFIEHVERERQEELYRMKMDFFTNVSHEFRTPLSLMIAPIEDLIDMVEEDSKFERRLTTIKNNSQRLLKLVNELLDFRKAETGLLKIHCEKQDIVAFCYEVFESFKSMSLKKNIEFKFAMESSPVFVHFDRYQMEKVLFNVLGNSFKFTQDNGKIVLSVDEGRQKSGWVHIQIKDNGIGIPMQVRQNIFQRFFQTGTPGMQNSGTGVGLALAKSIVELHQGKIEIIEEPGDWANTNFQISLRLGAEHLATNQMIAQSLPTQPTEPLLLADEMVFQQLGSATLQEHILPIPETTKSEKKTLFVVEDNEEFRGFIKDILEKDYRIIDFASAEDALMHLEDEMPDLILSDVMMEGMNGLEFCERVKSNETTNHIPVVLLTAKSSTDSEIEGLATGADSYISKPFSIKILKLNILNLLSTKEILRQKYSGNFIIDSDLKKLSTPEEIFIKKLMEIIESNLDNPDFNVSNLVKEIGMSRTVLYKKVNMLTSHSIGTLIRQVRLKKAADILGSTSYNISEVSFMVGFNDRKHFSREFKKLYGHSPSKYQQLNNKEKRDQES